MLKRICNLSAKVIMLQEIISGTIFVLFFGVISSITLLIFYPLMFPLKCLAAIANYADEQSNIYCERMQGIYMTMKGNKTNADLQS
jgi:hypothetical protein